MNRVKRIDFDSVEVTPNYAPKMVYITLQTDGEPKDLYWIWEIAAEDLKTYFDDELISMDIDNNDLSFEDAERFANDDDYLEDSDTYENGKEPMHGCWYAPLTMEQIEQEFGL